MQDPVTIYQIEPFRAADAAGAVAGIWQQANAVSDEDAQSFAGGTFPKHITWPHFRLFVAAIEGKPVGFIYGYFSQPGQWWHDQVRQTLIDSGESNWVDKSQELAEIAVLPAFQQRGIGTALIEAFLQDVEQPVLLALQASNVHVQSFYARHGFIDLLPNFRYEGFDDHIIVMGRPTDGE